MDLSDWQHRRKKLNDQYANLNLPKCGISGKSFIAQCIKYFSNFAQAKVDLFRNFIHGESLLIHTSNPL